MFASLMPRSAPKCHANKIVWTIAKKYIATCPIQKSKVSIAFKFSEK